MKDKSLLITAKHGETEYDTETILYSPLNTPLLLLSKEIATLSYAADGVTRIGGTVDSTASLYVNGNILPATYTWEFTDCEGEFEDIVDDLTSTITGSRGTITEITNHHTRLGVAKCTATVTADNAFNGKSYVKDFSVTKEIDGTGIVSQIVYYALVHYNYTANALARPESDDKLEVKTAAGKTLARLDLAEAAAET